MEGSDETRRLEPRTPSASAASAETSAATSADLIGRHDRICAALELTLDDYLVVRDSLIDMDLIAFDGTRFQVLSLPPAPVVPPPRPLVTQDDFEDHDFEDHDPATIQRILRSAFDRRR